MIFFFFLIILERSISHYYEFSQEGILCFHITSATDICMKEVIDSSHSRAISRKIMETLEALTLTIILINLVSKGLLFYYAVEFTGPYTA